MSDGLLLYTLLKDYHETAKHVKRLRDDQTLTPEEREYHRAAATGWFNAVFVLWQMKAITKETLYAVASPRAAMLWLEFVAPLDKAIRLSKGGTEKNPVEKWWTKYAKKELVMPGSSLDEEPDDTPETPEQPETAH